MHNGCEFQDFQRVFVQRLQFANGFRHRPNL